MTLVPVALERPPQQQQQEEEDDNSAAEVEVVEHHDIKTAIAGVAGNMLEWYDFSVFGYFSDIIGVVFFPPNQKGHAALIESFAVFGGAFLVRPIGGAIIGHMGDNHGRKSALETSILLMAFPTFALGCLPSFATVGWVSPVLLVIMRLLQGLSVGGQLMSSVVFTLERTDKKHWGIWGSTVFAASGVGTVTGSLVSYILRETLDAEQLISWGWRIPFLFGAFGVLPGAYLKYRSQEHPIPSSHEEQEQLEDRPLGKKLERNPSSFQETWGSANRRALIASALVPCISSAAYYIIFVWMAIFMQSIADPRVPHAFGINTATGVFSIFSVFLGGWIADWFGKENRVRLMVVTSLTIGAIAPWFIHLIGTAGNPFVAFACQSTMGLILSIWNGAMIPWIIQSFPPHLRLTSVNIGYNVAASLSGGFSPMIATLLVDRFTTYSPGFILTVFAVFAWVGLWLNPGNNTPTTSPNDGTKTTTKSTEMVSTTTIEGIPEQEGPAPGSNLSQLI
jgi:MHS family proline/betaine transporter-like MFS transporter